MFRNFKIKLKPVDKKLLVDSSQKVGNYTIMYVCLYCIYNA